MQKREDCEQLCSDNLECIAYSFDKRGCELRTTETVENKMDLISIKVDENNVDTKNAIDDNIGTSYLKLRTKKEELSWEAELGDD